MPIFYPRIWSTFFFNLDVKIAFLSTALTLLLSKCYFFSTPTLYFCSPLDLNYFVISYLTLVTLFSKCPCSRHPMRYMLNEDSSFHCTALCDVKTYVRGIILHTLFFACCMKLHYSMCLNFIAADTHINELMIVYSHRSALTSLMRGHTYVLMLLYSRLSNIYSTASSYTLSSDDMTL